MAIIQVPKSCILCHQALADKEKAVAILPIVTVTYGRRSQWWDFEAAPKPVEEGNYRVNFRNAKKERGLMHLKCWGELFNNSKNLYENR